MVYFLLTPYHLTVLILCVTSENAHYRDRGQSRPRPVFHAYCIYPKYSDRQTSKQCRPSVDATEHDVLSWNTPFANLSSC